MGIWPDRLFFTTANAMWGAGIGAAAALLALRSDAWSGGPSEALLLVGAFVLFGVGFAVASLFRRRLTVRGAFIVVACAVCVYVAWTLAVYAPAWAIVWAVALAGGLIGLARTEAA